MQRRRYWSGFAHVLVAWVLLMVQGVCDTAHFAALSLLPANAPLACAMPALSDEGRHAAICHCKMCRGGKTCCCLNARNEQEGMAYRAVCDTPEKSSVPGLVGPTRALPPPSFVVAVPLIVDTPRYLATVVALWRPYSRQPETPPPSVWT